MQGKNCYREEGQGSSAAATVPKEARPSLSIIVFPVRTRLTAPSFVRTLPSRFAIATAHNLYCAGVRAVFFTRWLPSLHKKKPLDLYSRGFSKTVCECNEDPQRATEVSVAWLRGLHYDCNIRWGIWSCQSAITIRLPIHFATLTVTASPSAA